MGEITRLLDGQPASIDIAFVEGDFAHHTKCPRSVANVRRPIENSRSDHKPRIDVSSLHQEFGLDNLDFRCPTIRHGQTNYTSECLAKPPTPHKSKNILVHIL